MADQPENRTPEQLLRAALAVLDEKGDHLAAVHVAMALSLVAPDSARRVHVAV